MTPFVWVYSTAANYSNWRPEGFARFLSDAQKARLERIRQARLLFDGHHRKYFLEEGRSQFDFPPVRAAGVWGDKTIQMYVVANLLRLISRKSADLVFGEEPKLQIAAPSEDAAGDPAIKAASKIQRAKLADLAVRSSLQSVFYEKAVSSSYEGEAFLESIILDGAVYLQDVPSDEIFPIGEAGPDRQYQRYERMKIENLGTVNAPIWLLLKIIYLPGRIERHLWQLDLDGNPMPRELSLDQWPLDLGEPPLLPLTQTGISDVTITYVPNEMSRGMPVSDYDGAIELQDELNAKQTQIARVLAKHSDPKLAAPQRMANEQGGMRQDNDLFFFETPDDVPRYITWNSELQHAIADREFTREQMLLQMEMSPALLGIQKQSSRAASFKAIRLESYNSLTKAQRKARYWRDGIRRSLNVCQQLENTLPGVRYDIGPISVELKDGIPVDELDQANQISILRAAGAMSLVRSIALQIPDPDAAAAEVDEIQAEDARKGPSISFAPPSAGPEGAEGKLMDEQPRDGVPGHSSEGPEAALVAAQQDQMEVAA